MYCVPQKNTGLSRATMGTPVMQLTFPTLRHPLYQIVKIWATYENSLKSDAPHPRFALTG